MGPADLKPLAFVLLISLLKINNAQMPPIDPGPPPVPPSPANPAGSSNPACVLAPNPSARLICEQLHKWDTGARDWAKTRSSIALPPGFATAGGTAPDLAPVVTSLEGCTEMSCVCFYLTGNRANGCTYLGKRVGKVVRKEYRMMTDNERQRFHAAFNQIKKSGKYQEIARVHAQMGQSGGAHSGPAFLGWHREFIKRVEFQLRRIDPDLYLPYWDSVLESRMPRPADSCLFIPELMGTAQGNVTAGPFANWNTLEDADLSFVQRQTQVDQVLAYTAPQQGCPFRPEFNALEYTHGNVHIFVGGDMFEQATAANDPIFFIHHSFVDYIWEMWRLARQTRAQRESDYPPDNQLCSGPQHFGASRMAPFNQYRNIDGLSNRYTDELYSYAPRPTCSAANPSCGSRFLFCDLSHGAPRCVSKAVVDGSCQGYVRGEDACYNGVCHGGVCRAGAHTAATVAPKISFRQPQYGPQADCWNENQCCGSWAHKGECTRNKGYMHDFCMASCGVCKPNPPLRDDCSDRHPSCASWAHMGECAKNGEWMAENCRHSCNHCKTSRAQVCEHKGKALLAPNKHQLCENSPGCFNEFACCPHWANQGLCRSNPQFMTCNCRVSCGMCFPHEYSYGACADYHKDCAGWAKVGECRKNPWMEENCRASCKTCFAQWELRGMCGATHQAGLIAGRRQQHPQRPQSPHGGWGRRDWGPHDHHWGDGGWGWDRGWEPRRYNGKKGKYGY